MDCGDVLADRFVVEESVARGGYGIVYRGWDLETESAVAVKQLVDLDATELQRFVREVSLLADSRLPGVVQYVAHGVDDRGNRYLVTEWLEGETLGGRLERCGFTIAEAVATVRAVCEPLAELHRRGLLHRDLKPENLIFVGESPRDIKLIDFGLARAAIEMATRVTATGMVLGTPGYMAPEQARGERVIQPRADVFSIGCILYECVAGYPAFAGDNYLAVLSKILIAHPVPLASLCPEAPPALTGLISLLLSKSPADRPEDAGAVATLLDSLGPMPDRDRHPWDAAVAETRKLSRPPALLEPSGVLLIDPGSGERADVRQVALLTGGRLDLISGGVLMLTIPTVTEIVDLSRRLVHTALAVRQLAAGARMAVSVGPIAIESSIDRAAVLLDQASRIVLVAPRPSGMILIDPQTTPLLSGEFVLERSSGAWVLDRPT